MPGHADFWCLSANCPPPQMLVPREVADMVGNISRISGACALLKADHTAQVSPRTGQ